MQEVQDLDEIYAQRIIRSRTEDDQAGIDGDQIIKAANADAMALAAQADKTESTRAMTKGRRDNRADEKEAERRADPWIPGAAAAAGGRVGAQPDFARPDDAEDDYVAPSKPLSRLRELWTQVEEHSA